MIKLIIGRKGTGKTKTLIEMVRHALETSKGSVVCIEKGEKLRFDIPYQCRLINADTFFIDDGQSLYGMIAGILASNHDVTDIFVDSALKICRNDAAEFDSFLNELETLSSAFEVNFVITSSLDPSEATETVRKFLD